MDVQVNAKQHVEVDALVDVKVNVMAHVLNIVQDLRLVISIYSVKLLMPSIDLDMISILNSLSMKINAFLYICLNVFYYLANCGRQVGIA